MGRSSQSPIWPFLLVVGFLFLLSIVAPREWEHIAHQDAGRQLGPESTAAGEAIADLAGNEAAFPSAAPYDNIDPLAVNDVGAEVASDPADGVQDEPRATDHAPTNDVAADIGLAETDAIYQQIPLAQELRDEQPSSPGASEANSVDLNVLRAANNPQSAESATAPPAVDLAESEISRQEAPSNIQKQAVDEQAPAAVASAPRWPVPVDLLRRLDGLSCECECTDWALQASQQILELCERTSPTDQRAPEILAQLRDACGAVDNLVPNIVDRGVVIELLRVRHALARRLDVWELLPEHLHPESAPVGMPEESVERLVAALDQLDTIIGQAGAAGQQWRGYLGLDALRALTLPNSAISPTDSKRLSGEILLRLDREDLSEVQRQFIASGPVVELADAVRPLSLGAFDAMRLLGDLERFEDTSQPHDARQLADDILQTLTLPDEQGPLSERLETNYRNANVRLALTEKFLQRLMPEASTSTDSVRDQILGVPTRGVSTTSTTVNVKLVPDEHRLRVALEASGQVLARTHSTSGPATLFTNSDSFYYARKLVDFDLHGIRTWPAESECLDARMRLRSVSTDFDGVPLVGALVETVARSRHAEKEDQARSVVRQKVEAQARRKMDTIAQERLDRVNHLLEERVVGPLSRLSLDPQVISAETSEERLTVRLRLAGQEQLAGHTPRPRAPGDSLLSFQLHQSTFNNICEQMKLEGRTWMLPELRSNIIASLNLKNSRFMDETDKDVSITFADKNAIRVRCENGRIELSLAVARLTNENRTWKNFVVRVFYEPRVEALQARLVRDGTVQLIGNRLNAASQIALRGIFSKAFAKDRDLTLVDPKWSADDRTRDLAFSQFVIQDGWIAVAVSEPPQNVARKSKSATAAQ